MQLTDMKPMTEELHNKNNLDLYRNIN